MTNIYQESEQTAAQVSYRISWGAIFAGVIVTIVLQLLFTLLGVGIGAASIEPLQQAQPGKGLGTGAAIWLFITTLISIFVGARLAANVSGSARKNYRMLHSVLTWGLTTVFSVGFLATTVGFLLGGGASLLGSATAAMNRGEQGYAATFSGYGASTSPGGQETSQAYGESATRAGSENQNATENAQADQRLRAAGGLAARRVSQAALWSFFVLLISGLIACYAGRAGTPAGWQRYRGNYGATAPTA